MNIANIYRDRTLDMLSEENVGETVRRALLSFFFHAYASPV